MRLLRSICARRLYEDSPSAEYALELFVTNRCQSTYILSRFAPYSSYFDDVACYSEGNSRLTISLERGALMRVWVADFPI